MKARSGDPQVKMLIDGEELAELKRHTVLMAEAFGLDSRIERYQGKRPIGLHRWDFDCLIDVVAIALEDAEEHPSQDGPGYVALKRLHDRLKDEYERAFE